MKEIYDFLSALEQNNNREWFDTNRDTYKKTQQQFLHITEVLINEIRTFDKEIGFLDSKKCVFRIFRDVRFSKDKRPYKTNYGTYIAKDGRKAGNPGYYFHIQPGHSFLAGGIFMPMPDKLRAIRTEIYSNPQDFLDIIEEDDFKNNFFLFDEDKLKTAPKGFPKDFEYIELLRYKSYSPCMNISDEQLLSPDIIEIVLRKFRYLLNFNQFLYYAIDEM